MAKVVNLRQARKAAVRDKARAEADANAVRHGLSKAAKTGLAAQAEKLARALDGHRREGRDD